MCISNLAWYVQTNLVQERNIETIKDACSRTGVTFRSHTAISFSDVLELPETTNLLIPYGSTTLIKNFAKANIDRSGLFFDSEKFRTSKWIKELGKLMLNSDSLVLPLNEVHKAPFETFFMKPDNDLKDFTGSVVDKSELAKFVDQISCGGFTFDSSIPVVICSPKNTGLEWRIFMIGDEVIAQSSYRLKNMLNQTKPANNEVIRFAKKVIRSVIEAKLNEEYVLEVKLIRKDKQVIRKL